MAADTDTKRPIYKRPILIGGLALSVCLWLLDSLQQVLAEVGTISFLGLLALAGGILVMKPRSQPLTIAPPPRPLDRTAVEAAIAQAAVAIEQLNQELATTPEGPLAVSVSEQLQALQTRWQALRPEMERSTLRGAIVGGPSVGKTTLLNHLQGHCIPWEEPRITWQEMADLPLTCEQAIATVPRWPWLVTQDVVIFLVTGDLTESERHTLYQLQQVNLRTVVALTKQDQYLPDEWPIVLQQVRQHLQGTLDSADLVAIAPAPSPLKVRQQQADGSMQEWLEARPADVTALTDRLTTLVKTEQPALILATTQRLAQQLQQEARTARNELRRQRALPVIEQYQWVAAAATSLNPVPTLDLLATTAINAQMVLDLGAIYQCPLSWQQAQTLATILASQMLKLGLVEVSTQLLGNVLKGTSLTFVVGAAIQGVSAAYLTRVAGLSLVEYFAQVEVAPETGNRGDRLRQIVQTVAQSTQRSTILQDFARQAIAALPQPNTTPADATPSQS
ncbi:slr1306 family protein [Trichothermofontia sp.]